MKRSTTLFFRSTSPTAWRTMALSAVIAGSLFAWHRPAHSEGAVAIPAPVVDEPASGAHQETVVLAGGCFWGVQGVFAHVKGVTLAVSGYSGGTRDTAHYEQVGGGDTGHAESVQITFDPAQVSYGRLLQIYFSVVQDPTQLNAQGPDTGTQYRSAIFPSNDAQRRVAQSYIAQLDQAHVFSGPIVTKVEPFKGFFPAEHYHQDFLTLHPDYPYIVINDLPKVDHLKKMFPTNYRAEPALAASKI